MIGLVVHAVHLPLELERLLRSLSGLGSILKQIKTCIVTEDMYGAGDMVKFNPALAKNIGLRKLLPTCDGAVCVDADYVLPPGLFELLLEPTVQPLHIWVRRRDCSEAEVPRCAWREWLHLPVFHDCRGSCNYLSRENWLKVGGWDERTYGWGGDDDVLHLRVAQFGIERRCVDAIPLMHVQHELRPWAAQGANGINNARWAQEDQENYLVVGATG